MKYVTLGFDFQDTYVSAIIECDYQPYEPSTLEYPGCPEALIAERVFVSDVNVTDQLIPSEWDEINEKIYKKLLDY
jgi:hypothetical protein